MFTTNPFAEISAFIPPAVMQTYVVLMIIMVFGGTLFDVAHKRSGAYFFRHSEKMKKRAKRQLSGGDMTSIAVKTAVVDVLTSGEFCNPHRRIAHLLGFYGFVIYLVATVIMVFSYPTPETPAPTILPTLWYIGAAMVMVGGYWFWFFIRVDVAKEGNSPLRLMRADLFVVSLLVSVTFGVIWAMVQAGGNEFWANIFLALYLLATTVLFVGVPWSKFSHMFYKPAAAFQKRVEEASGSTVLPPPADRPNL
jgi:hypothetical protein